MQYLDLVCMYVHVCMCNTILHGTYFMENTYTKTLFIADLKLKLNAASCIFFWKPRIED